MSQDILIAAYCPHVILHEKAAFLGKDRKTLSVANPIESEHDLKIYFNGEQVPSFGKLSPALISSTIASPFKLKSGSITFSKYLTLKTNPSSSFTVSFTAGYWSAVDIVNKINLNNSNTFIKVENFEGFLTFSDSSGDVGLNSIIQISASGGLSLLDLGLQSGPQQGQVIVPGWVFRREANGYIEFQAPVMSNPEIRVSYKTLSKNCPRCYASGIENDYNFDSFGQAILIQDENLLYQACLKMLLTKKGSNPYHTWYGTDLEQFIGSKIVSTLVPRIKTEISKALALVKDTQRLQQRSQKLSTKEMLYNISDVSVTTDPDNPQIFNINVTVSSGSLDPITLNIIYANSSSSNGL